MAPDVGAWVGGGEEAAAWRSSQAAKDRRTARREKEMNGENAEWRASDWERDVGFIGEQSGEATRCPIGCRRGRG